MIYSTPDPHVEHYDLCICMLNYIKSVGNGLVRYPEKTLTLMFTMNNRKKDMDSTQHSWGTIIWFGKGSIEADKNLLLQQRLDMRYKETANFDAD